MEPCGLACRLTRASVSGLRQPEIKLCYDQRTEANRHPTNTPPHRNLPISTPQASVLASLDTGNGAAVHNGECSTPGSESFLNGKRQLSSALTYLFPGACAPKTKNGGTTQPVVEKSGIAAFPGLLLSDLVRPRSSTRDTYRCKSCHSTRFLHLSRARTARAASVLPVPLLPHKKTTKSTRAKQRHTSRYCKTDVF
ncbi:unnamed protein product [Ectocarpus sp. 12 AP-2014]